MSSSNPTFVKTFSRCHRHPETAASQAAQAAYPERPITIVVPWAPGGSSDAFGRVLALYRSGRRAEAEEALGTACYSHPKVARSLTAKRMRAPRIDNPELGLNAEETAWLYRMEMRPVWEATPGALEWLRALTSAPRARRRGA